MHEPEKVWFATLFLLTFDSLCRESRAAGADKTFLLKAGLTGKAGYVKYPSLAVTTDSQAFVVYEEEIYGENHGVVSHQVWLKRYDSSGKDIGKRILLHEAADLGATKISVDGAGNLHMVWSEGGQCEK